MRHFCDTYILHIFCDIQLYVHYSIPGGFLCNNVGAVLYRILFFFHHCRNKAMNVTICKVEKSKKYIIWALKKVKLNTQNFTFRLLLQNLLDFISHFKRNMKRKNNQTAKKNLTSWKRCITKTIFKPSHFANCWLAFN